MFSSVTAPRLASSAYPLAICAALFAPNSVLAQAQTAALGAVSTISPVTDRPAENAYRGAQESRPAREEAEANLVEPLPVRISIGPEAVGTGTHIYPVRSEIGGKALLVSFSSSPPIQGSAGLAARPSSLPISGARLTSGFGYRSHPIRGGTRFHSGVDLAAPAGSPIVATSDGVIRRAGWEGGYGISVAIEHPGGLETRYGHLSALNVSFGQAVRTGDVIGFVGSTGLSTGPHVHYEVRVNGAAVNPLAR